MRPVLGVTFRREKPGFSALVSKSSAVAPSNTILESVNANAVAVSVVIVGEFKVGLVKVLFVKVCVAVVVTVPLAVAIVI